MASCCAFAGPLCKPFDPTTYRLAAATPWNCDARIDDLLSLPSSCLQNQYHVFDDDDATKFCCQLGMEPALCRATVALTLKKQLPKWLFLSRGFSCDKRQEQLKGGRAYLAHNSNLQSISGESQGRGNLKQQITLHLQPRAESSGLSQAC